MRKCVPVMRLIIVLLWISLYAIDSYSQDLSIKKVMMSDNTIIIHYDLLDSVSGRSYIVRAYASHDNYINPLSSVTGDEGTDILPGINKKIVIDPVSQYGKQFNDRVTFEIKARVFVPFIRFDGFDHYKKVRRGVDYNITWSGGTPQNILTIDLYRGDRKITSYPNIANVGHYKLVIPHAAKAGKNYRLTVRDSKNKDEVVHSNSFRVRRRVPLVLKVIPLVAMAGVVYFLAPQEKEVIPGPPNPN
jgi:hypothetical protein